MLTQLLEIAFAFWTVTAQMAPYLLLGFGATAILRFLVKPEMVATVLGRGGWRDAVRATLIGIPLPLCSCGVIPVAAALRKQGASPQSTVAFLTATPQTGVDSIAATWGLLGPLFSGVRVLAALVSGICGGILAGSFADRREEEAGCSGNAHANPPQSSKTDGASPCCASSGLRNSGKTPAASACCPAEAPAASACCPAEAPAAPCCCAGSRRSAEIADALRFAFVTLPKDIGNALLVGLILAGLIGAFLPPDSLGAYFDHPLLAYLAVTLLATPLYVCSTGSIPFAFGLMQAGFSPGAALVFLITGPATNAATISTMARLIGKRALVAYLGSILLCAWTFGLLFDTLGAPLLASHHLHIHTADPNLFQHLCAAVLLGLLASAKFRR